MTTVDELIVRIEADTRLLRRQLQQAGVAVGKFSRDGSRAMREIDRSTDNLSKSLGTLRTVLIAVGGAAVVRGLVRTADAFTLVNARLGLVTKSTQELDQVQEALFRSAQDTGTEYASLAELFTRVRRATASLGVETQTVTNFTELLSRAVVISGASSIEASNALRQLSQGLAAGALRGDEFRSVAEQLPFVLEVVERATGRTRGELREMAEDGQITADLLINAFTEFGDEINAEFEQIPDTVGRAMQRIENALFRAVGVSNEATGATGELAVQLSRLAEVMESPGFQSATEGFIRFLGFIVEIGAEAIQAIGDLATSYQDLQDQIEDNVQEAFLIDLTKRADELKQQIELLESELDDTGSLMNWAFGRDRTAELEELRAELERVRGEIQRINDTTQGQPGRGPNIRGAVARRAPTGGGAAVVFGGGGGGARGGGISPPLPTRRPVADSLEKQNDALEQMKANLEAARERQRLFREEQDAATQSALQNAQAVNNLALGGLRVLSGALRSNKDSWQDWAATAIDALAGVIQTLNSAGAFSSGGGGLGALFQSIFGAGAAASGVLGGGAAFGAGGGGGGGISVLGGGSSFGAGGAGGGGFAYFGGPRAGGGPVTGGSAYLVGEQGPEMFVPAVSGRVLSSPDTAAAMGGPTVTQSFDFRGAGPGAAAQLRAAAGEIERRTIAAVMGIANEGGPGSVALGRRRKI